MPRLKLLTLTCFDKQDLVGKDEPYLVVNGNTVWGPSSVGDGDSVDLDDVEPIPFATKISVDLYEKDPVADDHLGSSLAWAWWEGQGPKQLDFTGRGALYAVRVEVVGD